MAQLRKDPITREWVCIAVDRGRRPSDFRAASQRERAPRRPAEECPFCPGSEHLLADDLLVLTDGDPENPWAVRIVPNKYPALGGRRESGIHRDGIFETMAATGSHEVVIETPEHGVSLARMDVAQIERVLRACQLRFRALEADGHRYILLFRNHGPTAGASLEHAHSQIIASPMIPPNVALKIHGVQRYEEYAGRCVYADLLEHECRSRLRVIAKNEAFVSFAPFASKRPFEVWILPRHQDHHFARVDARRTRQLAEILRDALLRLDIALQDPPYNFALITTAEQNDFHWHIEILPRLSIAGGFELGSGLYINTVEPEHAAELLRSVRLPVEHPRGTTWSDSAEQTSLAARD